MAVAHALWMHSAPSESASADAARRSAVIARLIELGDASVRAVALRAVATLMSIDKRAGIELILSISVGEDSNIADELFANLRTVSPAELGSSGLTRVLDYMVSVQEIDYWAIRFLGEVGKVDPAATLSVLLRRIEVCDGWSDEDQKFRPVPFGQAIVPHELQFFSELELSPTMLRNALDVGFRLHGSGRYWFAELISNLAIRPLALIDALRSWCLEHDRERIEFVAESLRRIPAKFIFANASFVSSLVDTAASFGEDSEQRVRSAIFSAAISGVRTGTPFEAMPQDVMMIDLARTARSSLVAGTPAARLFRDIEEYGEQSVSRKKEHDIDVFGEPE